MIDRVVAGLGNIYVCETLYRGRIHPATKAGALKKKQAAANAKDEAAAAPWRRTSASCPRATASW